MVRVRVVVDDLALDQREGDPLLRVERRGLLGLLRGSRRRARRLLGGGLVVSW